MLLSVRSFFHHKYVLPLCVFIFGFILTLVSASQVVKDNQKADHQQIVEYSERHSNRIRTQIKQDVFFLGTLANLVDEESSYWITHFDRLSKHVMSGSSAIISIQWSPFIDYRKFDEHIHRIRDRYPSFTSFDFREGSEQRFLILREKKLPLFMVSQVYPTTEANLSILGYYSISERFKNTLHKMESSQEPFLSDRVFLLQDSYNKEVSDVERKIQQNGLLMYFPVFNQPRTKILGYFISAIKIDSFFEKYLKLDAVKSRGYSIKVFDHGPSGSDDPILYQSKTWKEQADDVEVSQHIQIYGRPWEIKYQATSQREVSITSNGIITLICGICISLLIALMVRFSLSSKEDLKHKLAKRTEELQYLVEHDTLTGLYNRYALCNHFEDLIQKQTKFSLITIDVDKFKHINDTYGHYAGDQVLKKVAEKMSTVILSGDMCARMGGDEFSILTMVIDKPRLTQLCHDICLAINVKPIELNGDLISVSVSIGAKRCHTANIDDLYHEADLEMYKSKSAGRNGFSVAA